MRYLNPAEIFDPPFDKKAIQRERKRLLADLELNDGVPIGIHGQDFGKSDIINYFEELQQGEVAAWHTAIWADKVLLGFLQDAHIDHQARFSDNAVYQNEEFIAWISPYFQVAFKTFVSACFDNPDSVAMKSLLVNPPLMSPEDTERAWQFVSGILLKNISLFEQFMGRGRRSSPMPMSRDRVQPYLESPYVDVIRRLPDIRFGAIKDQYAFAMQHPAISFFNHDARNRWVPIAWVENASQLAVSEDIRNQIVAKVDELNNIVKKRKRSYAWNLVWLVLILLRVFGTCNDGSNDSPMIMRNAPVFITDTVNGHLRTRILTPTGLHDTVLHDEPFLPPDTVTIDSLLHKAPELKVR